MIHPSEWVAAPWRNGGGITHEIARSGPAEGFTWRISLAEVDRAGPFSPFPGIDRAIALVSGDGFELSGPGLSARLDRPGQVFAFSGDLPVECTLIGGPVRDFNAMVDRSRARLAMECLRCEPGGALPGGDGTRVFFVLAGALRLEGRTLGPRTTRIAEPGEELRTEAACELLFARILPR